MKKKARKNPGSTEAGTVVVAVVIYNRFSNLERWIACWKQCVAKDPACGGTGAAELVIIHNYYGDQSAKEKYEQYCTQHGIKYVPRLGEGYDIGAFQDVCRGRLSGFPDYDYLLWCTDDCIPMQKDFIAPFLRAFAPSARQVGLPTETLGTTGEQAKVQVPQVGIACMKLYSYAGVGPWYPDHVRTTGFCLPKEVARAITFPVDPIQTKDHCWDFEVRAGKNTLYGQILSMGLIHGVVAPDGESPLWDTEFEERLPRQIEHDLVFNSSLPDSAIVTNPGSAGIVVAVVIYNRFQNLERWITCWKQCVTNGAELIIIHNYYADKNAKKKYGQYCAQHNIRYVPRLGEGYDIGAFQDVCRNRLSGFPNYDYLLWCTDDCLPMRKDFIQPFVSALLDPRVGVSCIQISSEWTKHVRTTGFCLRKATAEILTFPEDPVLTKEHCFAFEHRAGEGTFYKQILNMGLVPVTVAPDTESPLWDTEFRDRFGKVMSVDPRQMEHDRMFSPSRLDTIEKIRERNPEFEQLQKEVRLAGTDNLPFFANDYVFEGGLSLQQNPDEFAALCALLEERKPHATYVEIGSASGGTCLFLYRKLGFNQVLSLDDGKHPRATEQPANFQEIVGLSQYIGDSHTDAATQFLAAHVGPEGIQVAFIDGDHSYEGVMQDILLIKPFCKPGTLIVFHDIVAVPDVKQAWLDGASLKIFKPIAEYVGNSVPLGIGVAEVC